MPDNTQNSTASKVLENVLDQMLEGFQIIDKEWRYIYVNDTVAKQGKKSKEELIGKTMMEAYPGINKTPLFQQLQKCMTERTSIRFDNEFIFPDDSIGWFRLFINPCEEGIMIFSVDITEKKQAEIKLLEKMEELEQLSEGVVGRELKMAELKEVIHELQSSMTSITPNISTS